ncbi:transcriptional regulator, TetR family [Kribbella flavida DSM 17836]|uniref:Transcriptional regulator, TetR family n=1 Tax=Kribbella flavida (strain DSM 17836 / JCM 10339 / NBRC 14399) TaxID=479435 RepID=D2PLL4_KRIFD|nr:TetR/AcrR family transcriptional regulator [Kribbella flavida]ADB30643.1 transcriptional regulator, TetR family [Kribbella flavida DSM 17836]
MSSGRDASSHAAAGLTITTIVEAALAVVREHGLDGLTMRSLADRLHVRAPSLYHHVRNKDELLDLVARNAFDAFAADRAAYGQVETLDDWIAVTTAGSHRLRGFYAGHPGLAALIQAKATPYRDLGEGSRAALIRAQIAALTKLGVPEPEARALFEATAHWTLAAVAAGGPDHLFTEGLELFMLGVRTRLS